MLPSVWDFSNVNTDCPGVYQVTGTFLAPEGYEIESLPKPVDQESKFGKFRSSITLGDAGNVFIVHRLLYYQGNYPKEDYTDFLDFRKNIATQYGAKIILKKSGE